MSSEPLELNLELTLEQQFQMRLMEQSTQGMSREQAISLLLETARLLMMKDNAIRSLVKQIV
ncbi:photosystem I reaction center subunit XII [Hydrococcus rivularis NIES-593]|uniref:Photosystem I reaction center subunit XII n=1 Tax=Hydrococcus rivularis NIES-593 TaxID=1921803 RepID=A0A1U7HRA4_9CYAN|nr:NblA/ycf18 family protein [Hydrococcus rivularis]OKH26078.1 photosystem I reaction center subunit XII [Hydrococcus rivularis NIES-593]